LNLYAEGGAARGICGPPEILSEAELRCKRWKMRIKRLPKMKTAKVLAKSEKCVILYIRVWNMYLCQFGLDA